MDEGFQTVTALGTVTRTTK